MSSARAWLTAAVAMAAVGLVGCSSTVNLTPPAPGSMLLPPTELPNGFNAQPATVTDLRNANDADLAAAANWKVVPAECRPTVDAAVNKKLDSDSAAVLTASSMTASLANVVFVGTRDLTADEKEHTGRCATTRTTIVGGTREGAVIASENRELTAPQLDGKTAGRLGQVGRLTISRMLLVRTDTTTTMPDGAASRKVSFAGYADAKSPGADDDKHRFTIQLTVVGQSTRFAKPFPEVRPPMTDKQFAELFSRALVAAGKA
ncbi:MAG: hypothetical protein QM728_01915 [Gordonia sp. (in: high G+C Gram-positive bacteria)]|uniref:hypothetical protein n=1 Tax=Gordonia sp. (in: high G+C Gram-positive bacteria) TaxID=84139 RepID=UPI0039E5665A